MLRREEDKLGAVLKINSGAGGTESVRYEPWHVDTAGTGGESRRDVIGRGVGIAVLLCGGLLA